MALYEFKTQERAALRVPRGSDQQRDPPDRQALRRAHRGAPAQRRAPPRPTSWARWTQATPTSSAGGRLRQRCSTPLKRAAHRRGAQALRAARALRRRAPAGAPAARQGRHGEGRASPRSDQPDHAAPSRAPTRPSTKSSKIAAQLEAAKQEGLRITRLEIDYNKLKRESDALSKQYLLVRDRTKETELASSSRSTTCTCSTTPGCRRRR